MIDLHCFAGQQRLTEWAPPVLVVQDILWLCECSLSIDNLSPVAAWSSSNLLLLTDPDDVHRAGFWNEAHVDAADSPREIQWVCSP
jgi:hypothetical protein